MIPSAKNKLNIFYKILSFPYFFIFLFFVLFPILIIVFDSFQEHDEKKLFYVVFTLKHYLSFYQNWFFIYVLLRSASIAVIATFLIFIIAYPLAYIVSKKNLLKQSFLVLLINGTIWINMILKIQALVQILSLIEKFLCIKVIETNIAMFIGYIYLFLPYMFLSIYLSIIKIDINLIEAAKDLGADEKQIFQRVIFPLSLPGLIAGISLVSLQIVTNIVVPKYLGPTTINVISELIENKTFLNGDIKGACAIAVNLTLLMLFILIFSRSRINKNEVDIYAKNN